MLDLKKLLNKLLSLLSTPIIVRKNLTASSVTIAANSIGYVNTYSLINTNCPTGYTFLGIVGWSSNHGSGAPFSFRYQDNQYATEIWNRSSSSITITPVLQVLYIKSSLFGVI